MKGFRVCSSKFKMPVYWSVTGAVTGAGGYKMKSDKNLVAATKNSVSAYKERRKWHFAPVNLLEQAKSLKTNDAPVNRPYRENWLLEQTRVDALRQ